MVEILKNRAISKFKDEDFDNDFSQINTINKMKEEDHVHILSSSSNQKRTVQTQDQNQNQSIANNKIYEHLFKSNDTPIYPIKEVVDQG